MPATEGIVLQANQGFPHHCVKPLERLIGVVNGIAVAEGARQILKTIGVDDEACFVSDTVYPAVAAQQLSQAGRAGAPGAGDEIRP